MIASLTGTVVQTAPNSIVIDVGGVGFLVNVTPQLSASANRGSSISLQTRFIVREDSMSLFGFELAEEAQTFDLLTSVSGVGPKLGLAIIASLNLETIANAVANEADHVFRSVPGVGLKTAKLLAVTLAGKLTAVASTNHSDLVDALMGLGYQQKAAIDALAKIEPTNDRSLALKRALAALAAPQKQG